MTKLERQKEWDTRITEYQASGLSVQEWCSANNVKSHQLWYWLRKQKTIKEASLIQSNQWLPLEVSEYTSVEQDNALVLRVGKTCIEVNPGFDPTLLSQVVRVLTALC